MTRICNSSSHWDRLILGFRRKSSSYCILTMLGCFAPVDGSPFDLPGYLLGLLRRLHTTFILPELREKSKERLWKIFRRGA